MYLNEVIREKTPFFSVQGSWTPQNEHPVSISLDYKTMWSIAKHPIKWAWSALFFRLIHGFQRKCAVEYILKSQSWIELLYLKKNMAHIFKDNVEDCVILKKSSAKWR